jgi:predicted metal-dependent hydrolase
MKLEWPPDLDPVFIRGEPEESYLNVALSLLLPYLEPYLIRTMRAARPFVSSPELAEQLDRFIAQEGQHYQQHRRFNDVIRGRGFEAIEPLERELEADYRRFTAEKSLRFNLAYAEGFEALTTAMSLAFIEQPHDHWDPQALELFLWHLTEELEHRCVAFDVYQEVGKSYLHRVAGGAFAQWHLIRFLRRAAGRMIAARPDVIPAHGGRDAAESRRRRLDRRRASILWSALLTHTPWYSPHRLRVPPVLDELSARFSASAASID